MISEFNALSEKVGRLAAMALALRQENAALRLQLSNLGVQHEELAERMGQAHLRLEAILDKLPQVPLAEAELETDPEADPDGLAAATPAIPELAEEKTV